MELKSLNTIFLLILFALLFFIRKNTLLNLLLFTFSIPFETYVNFKIGFTLKPAQIFAISTFFSMVSNKERPFTSVKEHLPYLLILLAQVLSLINAPQELIFKSYQGSIKMILNLGLLYFIAYTISYAVKNLVILRKVVLTLIAGGVLSVLIELARAGFTDWMAEAYLAWLPGGYIRLAPFNMWSNTYAGYLLIVLVFLTVYIFQRSMTQNKLFRNTHTILLAIVLYGFILTFSRGSWLSYALASVIIVWYAKENIIKSLTRYAFCAVISLLLLLTVYPKTLKPVLERAAVLPIYNAIFNITTTERIDPTTTERIDWYKDSIEMFLSHPIIGNGWASNLIPHNIILQILSESGGVGLSAFTIFAFFVMRRSYRAVNSSHEDMKFFAVGILAGLWGTAIHLMTDIGLYHIQTWFIIGLALAVGRISEIKPDRIRKNIFIIKIGAIGDLLMTTPAIRALKKANPEASVSLLVGKSSKAAVGRNAYIDELIEVDDYIFYKGSLLKRFFHLLPLVLKLRKKKYDTVFVFHRDWRFNFFAFLCNIPERVGFDRDGKGMFLTKKIRIVGIIHHIDHYLEVIKSIGVKEDGKEMDFAINSPTEEKIKMILIEKGLKEKDILIGISAGGAKNIKEEMASRRWPLDRYVALISRLSIDGYKILLFGSKTDDFITKHIHKYFYGKNTDSIIDLIGLFSLEETAGAMKKCKVIVTHDSGPMHLASALGVPVVAVFGPTDPREKYSMSPMSHYFWKESEIPCAPCYRDGIFPNCKTIKCMKSVKVEEVYDKVMKIIGKCNSFREDRSTS